MKMKFDVANRLIWLKGQLLNVNDAKINVLSPTSQFGLNVFEGIPCYWNEAKKQLFAFRLDDHYNRLMKSARLLQIDCPYTKEELKKALYDVVCRRFRLLGVGGSGADVCRPYTQR